MRNLQRRIFIVGIVGVVIVFIFCLSLQGWIERGLERQELKPMSFETQPLVRGPLLGVVVPLVAGDIARGVESIKRWPIRCTENTLNRVDLILYFAGEPLLELHRQLKVASGSTSCFKATRMVGADLRPEKNQIERRRDEFSMCVRSDTPRDAAVKHCLQYVDFQHPDEMHEGSARSVIIRLKAASDITYAPVAFDEQVSIVADVFPQEKLAQGVQSALFYKLFVEPDVRGHFAGYDALAIVDWDTIIAKETAFERLYRTAFEGSEPFWVKGSHLGGAYSDIGTSPGTWQPLEHLDGNAIYNNTDNDFLDFVNITLDKWHFTRPYAEALWSTISDYPYSWPLWQQYASKFVATNLVSMVEIGDEEDEAFAKEIPPDTILLRRRDKSTGTRLNAAEGNTHGCRPACGSWEATVEGNASSTVCDATCVRGHPWAGIRFDGHNCGAGDPSKYGTSCRLCYNDQHAALHADRALAASKGTPSASYGHVIMCDTKRPPEAMTCSRECTENVNTICDGRCGNGLYGDWNCDWRSLGDQCRFCFHDITAARRADMIAREDGGRVIMCKTHEPPPEGQDMDRVVGIGPIIHDYIELGAVDSTLVHSVDPNELLDDMDPAATQFIGDIRRGNICIFIPGYFEFFHETRLTVASIEAFMPGVRMVIATHPMDYHAYHKNLNVSNTALSIVNDTRVAYAPLAADKACGYGTRLIYYMGPGEILSRPFTAKDTHSPEGKLLVKQTAAEVAGGEHARRSMGTSIVLGFHGLSFTYNSDLILPANINAQLREKLRTTMNESGFKIPGDSNGVESVETSAFHEFLDSMSSDNSEFASIFIPELLAAHLFSQNPAGVQFLDPRHQRHRDSAETKIRDVLLVKPRFGCSMDLSPTLQGYDVAQQLGKHLETFRRGARCDRGFVTVDSSALKLKEEWEFPAGYPTSLMPSLQDFRISVMYRSFSGDAELFEISLPTAIKHIPHALEIVVVVEEVDGDLFEKLVSPYRESAPFPLRVVTEPSIMNGHIQQKYSKMRADLYTKGDYILHLDSDVLVLREVNYDDIFHLGKPVLPYRRYRDDTQEGRALILCWQNGTSFAIGEDVVHEFNIFSTHVYPRKMYQALRKFVEDTHEKSFGDFMSTRVGKCGWSASKWRVDEPHRLLSDFNLIGAFLWYHAPEAVYWMAADPYDLRPDQWRIDLIKYQWVCQANGRSLPEDAAGKVQFKADFLTVTNVEQCNSVVQQWRNPKMKNPETRTAISRAGR